MSKITLLTLFIILFPTLTYANQAGVVVKGQNGQEKTACVSFSQDAISGVDLLKQAGFDPVLDNGFMVSINGEEAKSFNDPDSSDDYWSYWLNSNSNWQYSPVGPATKQVKDGELDGWERGDSKLRLSAIKFSNVCQVEQKVTTTQSESAPQANTTAPDSVNENQTKTNTSSTTSAPSSNIKQKPADISTGENKESTDSTNNSIVDKTQPDQALKKIPPKDQLVQASKNKVNSSALISIFLLTTFLSILISVIYHKLRKKTSYALHK
jgi:hypothetical protein